MHRTRRIAVRALAAVALLLVAPTPADAGTGPRPTEAPLLACEPGSCRFDPPPGVVHDGFRFWASSREGVPGSYGWWHHETLQPPGTYVLVQLCNGPAMAEGREFTDNECGPASVVHRVPAPHAKYRPTGTVNGYPCGGDLPPCWVLRRESGGDPTAQNPRSSASGLWQFVDGTWARHGGYAKARYAPAEVQNEKAAQVWDGGRGCSHWSACA